MEGGRCKLFLKDMPVQKKKKWKDCNYFVVNSIANEDFQEESVFVQWIENLIKRQEEKRNIFSHFYPYFLKEKIKYVN